MLALLMAECFESFVILAGDYQAHRLGLRLVAFLQLGAPLYHAFGVRILIKCEPNKHVEVLKSRVRWRE